jgi:hypothetical protein
MHYIIFLESPLRNEASLDELYTRAVFTVTWVGSLELVCERPANHVSRRTDMLVLGPPYTLSSICSLNCTVGSYVCWEIPTTVQSELLNCGSFGMAKDLTAQFNCGVLCVSFSEGQSTVPQTAVSYPLNCSSVDLESWLRGKKILSLNLLNFSKQRNVYGRLHQRTITIEARGIRATEFWFQKWKTWSLMRRDTIVKKINNLRCAFTRRKEQKRWWNQKCQVLVQTTCNTGTVNFCNTTADLLLLVARLQPVTGHINIT